MSQRRELRPALRAWWQGVTFGARHPRRRIAALGALGAISGLGETAVVLLLVAMVSSDGGVTSLVPVAGTWSLAMLGLVAVAILAAAHLGAGWIAANAADEALRSVQLLLVDAFLDAPWTAQRSAPPGQLQDLVCGKARLVVNGTAEAAKAVSTAASLLIVVVAAVAVEARATAALLAVVAFAVILGRPLQMRIRRLTVRVSEASSALAVKVAETSTMAGDLRIFGVRERARDQLATVVETNARLLREVQLASATGPALTRDATLGVLVIAMALVVVTADVSLTVLGATVVLVMRALTHTQTLTSTLHRLADRWANLTPITARLEDWKPQVETGRRRCRRIRDVELRAVSFAHASDGPDAVRDASLVVADGEQLGVIGPTGAGKSTLAALLLGLLRPRDGLVLVDGVPLEEIDPRDWHARTAWVGQSPTLLSGTVRDNIRFLRPQISDDAIERAARQAVLGADLESWPGGLDHDVGTLGVALSGGQRQRVALARALAGTPQLVVLDEPTSALDVHTEVAVRETLGALRGSASVVVIAHRLSTINLCDRVAVLRDGQVVALGPPGELAHDDPYYREALALSAPDATRT